MDRVRHGRYVYKFNLSVSETEVNAQTQHFDAYIILGNPGVIHYVTLHSSPLGQLTDETSFSMNIHNTGEYLNS